MTGRRAALLGLLKERRTQEAISLCAEALGEDPGSADLLFLLGLAFEQAGDAARARDALERSVQADPNRLEVLGTLANLLTRGNLHGEAHARLQQARALDPDHPSVRFNLGNALLALGQTQAAAAEYQAAVALKPDHHGAWHQMAVASLALQRADEALIHVRRARSFQENSADYRLTEAACHVRLGAWAAAISAYRDLRALAPGDWRGHAGLAAALTGIGAADQAEAHYLEALRLAPGEAASIWSNYLMSLQYRSDLPLDRLIAAHRAFQSYQPAQTRTAQTRTAQARTAQAHPGRMVRSGQKLRIGFVSADFCGHPVGRFSLPVLQGLDRDRFVAIAYDATPATDALSAKLRDAADGWREIRGVGAVAAAEQIRRDQIDILIDLSGHTGQRRLDVLALRPAPIQIGWLGYPGPYAWAGIDHRLSDAIIDPLSEDGFGDAVIRLDRTPLHHPPPPSAQINARPERPLTFGSFNNLAKLDPQTLAHWRALLTAFPDSRLLLKGKGAEDQAFSDRLDQAFEGVRDRVETLPWAAAERDHLALYRRIDVALDPLFYNGTTTTCEALAAGAPVLSRRGDRPAGRMGDSLMASAGLPEWVRGDEADMIGFLRASQQTLNPARLRNQVAASKLCDLPGFLKSFEAALVSSALAPGG